MVIADQKKRENIAEYILYMWQLEDLLRSVELNPDAVGAIAEQFDSYGHAVVDAAAHWYRNMIRQMKSEKIEQAGHLREVQDIVIELFYLHNTLLNISKDKTYQQLYADAATHLQELRKRSGRVSNEVEMMFNALYGLWLLRLQKAQIAEETETAMASISKLTAFLAAKYKQMKSGEMDFSHN